MLAAIVDALPRRLWHSSNLYLGGRLHFCRKGDARTVEWNGRIIAAGRQPFPEAWWQAERSRLEAEDDE